MLYKNESVEKGLTEDRTPHISGLLRGSVCEIQLRENMSCLCFYGYYHKYLDESNVDQYTE